MNLFYVYIGGKHKRSVIKRCVTWMIIREKSCRRLLYCPAWHICKIQSILFLKKCLNMTIYEKIHSEIHGLFKLWFYKSFSDGCDRDEKTTQKLFYVVWLCFLETLNFVILMRKRLCKENDTRKGNTEDFMLIIGKLQLNAVKYRNSAPPYFSKQRLLIILKDFYDSNFCEIVR